MINPQEAAKKGEGWKPAFTQRKTAATPKTTTTTEKGENAQLGTATISGSLPPGVKSVLDADIDGLEDKPWRKSGVDITDYFNYGFNEESWRNYLSKQVCTYVYL